MEDKAKGRIKEAYGAITGDEEKKAEGRAQQRKAHADEQAAQRAKTRQAGKEAKEAERERDRQQRKQKSGLHGRWRGYPVGTLNPRHGQVSSIHRTNNEAARTARGPATALNEPSQMLVHKKDGTVQTERTYGWKTGPLFFHVAN
jgi:uncharacterized protein YjbJ (UPF0337 family)